MKTLFTIYKVSIIIGQNKNSQNAQNVLASGFFQNAQFYGQNWKKINLYNFLVRENFQKLPENFPKTNLVNLSEHMICQISNFFGSKEKLSTYIICPKLIRQNEKNTKFPQAPQIFLCSLENSQCEWFYIRLH